MKVPAPLTHFDLRPSRGLLGRLKDHWSLHPAGLADGTSWPQALDAAAVADAHRSQWGAVWLAFAQAVEKEPSLLSDSDVPLAIDGMLRTALRPQGFSNTDTNAALDAVCLLLAKHPTEASRCLVSWVNSPQGTPGAPSRFLELGASPQSPGDCGQTVFQRAVARLWVNAKDAVVWTRAGAQWEGTTPEGQNVLHLVLGGGDTPERRMALQVADAHVRARVWVMPDHSGVCARDRLAAVPSLMAAFPDIRRRADAAVARRQSRATEKALETTLPPARAERRRRM